MKIFRFTFSQFLFNFRFVVYVMRWWTFVVCVFVLLTVVPCGRWIAVDGGSLGQMYAGVIGGGVGNNGNNGSGRIPKLEPTDGQQQQQQRVGGTGGTGQWMASPRLPMQQQQMQQQQQQLCKPLFISFVC